jgi:histidinol dehydrogenase
VKDKTPKMTFLKIDRLDASSPSFSEDIAGLRTKLSPDGSVVSERGTQLTIQVFGEPLSPQMVVDRICNDVKQRGTAAVLKYAQALDNPNSSAEPPTSARFPNVLISERANAGVFHVM